MWKKFAKKKPKKDGWYQCTVEVRRQQRYVMDLYYYASSQRFVDNRRQNVFTEYTVIDWEEKHLSTDLLCDRTDSVVAWRKMPRTYMRGFKPDENHHIY